MNYDYTHNRFLKIFCIIACGFILYSFALSAPFKTLDDRASISSNKHVSNLQYVPDMFRKSFFGGDFYYRPLVSLSFALERYFFGLDYFFFNLTNLLIHLSSGLVVFALMSLLLKDENLGFWIAFLFVIHPVQSEAVANIAGRSILLCAFFELTALLCFALFIQKERKRFFVLSLLSFALALLSKESSAPMPMIIFAYGLFAYQGREDFLKKALKPALWYFGVLIAYLVLRKSLGIASMPYVMGIWDHCCGVLTFLRSLFTYFHIIVAPSDLYFDRIRPVIYNFLGLESLLTIGSWSVIVFLFCRLYRRFKPQVLLLLAFVALRFLPLSQIIPIRSQAQYICIPDHFLYVPSVGLLALVVILFHAGSSRGLTQKYVSRTFLRVLVAGWIAFLCLTTIEQNIYATNEIAMDKRSVSFSPRHVRMNITLGLNYAIEGDFKNAQKYFQLALDYEPTNVRALIGLGTALLDQGQYWQGLEVYDKIASLGDFKELVDENKKLAYRILTEKYRAMQKAQPSNAEIYYSLGVVFAKNNAFEDAIGQFEKALELDPAHSNARLNLCNCYKAFGQMEKADQCFLTLKEK